MIAFLKRGYRLWKHDRAMFTVHHALNYLANESDAPNDAFEILWDTLVGMVERRKCL